MGKGIAWENLTFAARIPHRLQRIAGGPRRATLAPAATSGENYACKRLPMGLLVKLMSTSKVMWPLRDAGMIKGRFQQSGD